MWQDTLSMELSVMTTVATTLKRPCASGLLDSDAEGNISPWGVLHSTRGSGYHPTEVHSSQVAPLSCTPMRM